MKEVYILAKDVPTWINKYFNNQDLVSVDYLIGIIEELDEEVERLNEELENTKQYYQDNFKQISDYELYNVNESDFN